MSADSHMICHQAGRQLPDRITSAKRTAITEPNSFVAGLNAN
jgi:hypothetical protein